jgi:hypothetical protein
MTVAKEMSKYKLDLMRLQEARWDTIGTEPAGEYIYFFLYVRESYQQLRG